MKSETVAARALRIANEIYRGEALSSESQDYKWKLFAAMLFGAVFLLSTLNILGHIVFPGEESGIAETFAQMPWFWMLLAATSFVMGQQALSSLAERAEPSKTLSADTDLPASARADVTALACRLRHAGLTREQAVARVAKAIDAAWDQST